MHKGRAVFSPALAFLAAVGVSSGAPSQMGRRFAPYKRFGPLAQILDAGAIHLPRADKIPPGGLPARPAVPGTGRAARRPGEGHRLYGAPNRAQHSGSVGERRSKGAIEEWPPGRSENSGLCDDAAMQDEAD